MRRLTTAKFSQNFQFVRKEKNLLLNFELCSSRSIVASREVRNLWRELAMSRSVDKFATLKITRSLFHRNSKENAIVVSSERQRTRGLYFIGTLIANVSAPSFRLLCNSSVNNPRFLDERIWSSFQTQFTATLIERRVPTILIKKISRYF